MLIMWGINLQAQFAEFEERTEKNRFLKVLKNSCSSGSSDCGNGSITELLQVNFLDPDLLGKQFYFFNDFIYWMGRASKGFHTRDLNTKINTTAGVFMVKMGTSSYLQKIFGDDVTCPDGKTLMVAQLKYNDGRLISTWSQDAICLAPTDTFKISVVRDADTTVPFRSTTETKEVDDQGIDWMKDEGPTERTYSSKSDGPRKIRFELKSGDKSTSQPQKAAKK